jgi:hypothetical protein
MRGTDPKRPTTGSYDYNLGTGYAFAISRNSYVQPIEALRALSSIEKLAKA